MKNKVNVVMIKTSFLKIFSFGLLAPYTNKGEREAKKVLKKLKNFKIDKFLTKNMAFSRFLA